MRWFTVLCHYVLYLNTFLFTQKVAFEATMQRSNCNKCCHILHSYFYKMMAPRLGKFGTTIYHGVCTWVIEWVSEWSYAYQSPHKNFLTSFRYHKLKMNKFFYMSKLKLPKGCTCEEYANRWLHVPQCFALWVAIIFIITHTVNGFYLFSREQIDCVNAELHENDFIIDNFFTYYECAIAWVIEYIVNVYFELIPLGKWLFVFDCNIKILQCSNR